MASLLIVGGGLFLLAKYRTANPIETVYKLGGRC